MMATLRKLLTNQIVMIALLVGAMLIPVMIAALFGGPLRTQETFRMTVGTGCGMLVLAFWAVSTYLLLQEKWTLHVKLFAAFAATFLALFFTAFPFAFLLWDAAGIPSGVLEFAIAGYATLYFLQLCLIGERFGKTAVGTAGYTLLVFYWPLTRFAFRDRLKNAFEQAANSRNRRM